MLIYNLVSFALGRIPSNILTPWHLCLHNSASTSCIAYLTTQQHNGFFITISGIQEAQHYDNSMA